MPVRSDTNEPVTRRIAPRYRLEVPVRISTDQRRGEGTTADMSASGVRVESSNIRPPDGLKIELRFAFFPNSPPIRISAEVVRTTESGGFAARFYDLDWRMQRVLRAILPTVGAGKVEDPYDDTASFSGKLIADLGPELHRDCALAARSQDKSLKDWFRGEMKKASERTLMTARGDEEHTSRTLKDGPCPCPKCLERRS